MSRSPKPGQRTRRGRGPRKQRQATSGSAGAVKPRLPPSQRTKQRRTRGPGSALGAHPARERAQRLEMAVKEEEGLRKASLAVLLVSGRPAYETGAGGASLGCHLWRSIPDGRSWGWRNSVAGSTEQRREPGRASGQPQERSLRWPPPRGWAEPELLPSRAWAGRGGEDDWHSWLPPGSPRSRRKR